MKKKYLLFLLVLALGIAHLLKTRAGGGADTGGPAPDFMLNDLEESRFYLSEKKGAVVLLNFWSVHCAPCIREMPWLQSLQDTQGENKLQVIGICTDPAGPKYVKTFLKGLNVSYQVLLDPENRVTELYGVTALPTTCIIDSKGIIRLKEVGYSESGLGRIEKMVQRFTAKHPE